MPSAHRRGFVRLWLASLALVSAFLTVGSGAFAQPQSLNDLLSSVVRIKTSIDPEAQTAATLGREREGSGVVIDDNVSAAAKLTQVAD